MIRMQEVEVPCVALDIRLPQGLGAISAVGFPAVGAGEASGGVQFGDQAFVGIEIPGGEAVDGFGDPSPEGVVLVAGLFLSVALDGGQAVGGVVVITGAVVGGDEFGPLSVGAGIEGGERVAPSPYWVRRWSGS